MTSCPLPARPSISGSDDGFRGGLNTALSVGFRPASDPDLQRSVGRRFYRRFGPDPPGVRLSARYVWCYTFPVMRGGPERHRREGNEPPRLRARRREAMPVVATICLPHLDVDAEGLQPLGGDPAGGGPAGGLPAGRIPAGEGPADLLERSPSRGPVAWSPRRLWNLSAVVAALASA
jgi:hypothetical protein